jgi:hypothetical protein
MTSVEFVQALTTLAPTIAELEESVPDLDMEEYESWRNEFIPQRLVSPRVLSQLTQTELDTLFSHYDLSGVLILGSIHFYEQPLVNGQLVTVASGEAGTFSLSALEEVRLNDDFGSFLCARTVASFFAAIVTLSDYYRQRLLGKIASDDTVARAVYAERAAQAAGEPQADQDYLHLLNASC